MQNEDEKIILDVLLYMAIHFSMEFLFLQIALLPFIPQHLQCATLPQSQIRTQGHLKKGEWPFILEDIFGEARFVESIKK